MTSRLLPVRKLGTLTTFAFVTARIDHANLLYMANSEDFMLRRWFIELHSYPVRFQLIKGIANPADAPSRVASTVNIFSELIAPLQVIAALSTAPTISWKFSVGDIVSQGTGGDTFG